MYLFELLQLIEHAQDLTQGVPCEPEALIMGALGGLVYIMSIHVDVPVKNVV